MPATPPVIHTPPSSGSPPSAPPAIHNPSSGGGVGGILVSGVTPTLLPLYLAGTENGFPYYSSNGLNDALPHPQCVRIGAQWYIDNGYDAAWVSSAASAATPNLATGWTKVEDAICSGTPVITSFSPRVLPPAIVFDR